MNQFINSKLELILKSILFGFNDIIKTISIFLIIFKVYSSSFLFFKGVWMYICFLRCLIHVPLYYGTKREVHFCNPTNPLSPYLQTKLSIKTDWNTYKWVWWSVSLLSLSNFLFLSFPLSSLLQHSFIIIKTTTFDHKTEKPIKKYGFWFMDFSLLNFFKKISDSIWFV